MFTKSERPEARRYLKLLRSLSHTAGQYRTLVGDYLSETCQSGKKNPSGNIGPDRFFFYEQIVPIWHILRIMDKKTRKSSDVLAIRRQHCRYAFIYNSFVHNDTYMVNKECFPVNKNKKARLMLNEQGDRIKGGQSSFAKQHTESRQACHPPRHPRHLVSMWDHDARMARE